MQMLSGKKIIKAATQLSSASTSCVAYPIKINPRRLMGWIEVKGSGTAHVLKDLLLLYSHRRLTLTALSLLRTAV